MSRNIVRLVAAAVLAAAAGFALPSAPASAAACPSNDGVTVVVDFHELGGGVQSACVADGGGDTAAQLFGAAGFSLSYVQRQPGFVCRVDGVPADDPCVNTPPGDAYWGLWWSDGKSGSWSYATTSAGGQRVPEGGYVGFSWNGSSTRSTPGLTPAPRPTATPTPSPTKSPSHQPSSSAPPSSQPSQQGSVTPSASASSDPSDPSGPSQPSKSSKSSKPAKPGDKKSRSAKPSASATSAMPSASESPSESADDVVPTSAEPAEPDGGLPAWVAPAAIVMLFGAAGAAAVVRRRRGVPGA